MTLRIQISAEKEATFQALAQSQGLTVEQWLLQLAEQQALVANACSQPDRWEEDFDAWVGSFPIVPPLSDEAISRANLYPDRW